MSTIIFLDHVDLPATEDRFLPAVVACESAVTTSVPPKKSNTI